MARRRNWERTKRDRERAERARAERDAQPTYAPGAKGALPPTGPQLEYIASLCRKLGRPAPEVGNRRTAVSLIASLKQQVAVTRRQK